MRWLIAAVAALVLTGCGQSHDEETQEGDTQGRYEVIVVDTEQGPVECVVWDGFRAGGIDCNFIAPTP